MVKAKNIPTQRVEHFDECGNSIGFLTRLENLDLRVQIKEHAVEGYSIMFEGVKIPIDKTGRFKPQAGLYDQELSLLAKIL